MQSKRTHKMDISRDRWKCQADLRMSSNQTKKPLVTRNRQKKDANPTRQTNTLWPDELETRQSTIHTENTHTHTHATTTTQQRVKPELDR